MALIYILHFDEPICHARHYVGVTSDEGLIERLKRHATGRGARLTQVCLERGVNWKLGGLIRTTGHPRIDEDRIKQIKHHKRYCEYCSNPAARLKGTQPMSIALVKVPTDSKSLRGEHE
jgi:predicted GIY-YIG superfamily endonuclease